MITGFIVNEYVYISGVALALIYLCIRFIFIVLPSYKELDNISFISGVYGIAFVYILLPIAYLIAFFKNGDIHLLADISASLLHIVALLMINSLIINFPRRTVKEYLRPAMLIFIPAMVISAYNLFIVKQANFYLNLVFTIYLIVRSIFMVIKVRKMIE